MLYPSPSNSKELLLVGVDAGKAEERIADAMKSQYPKFNIFTDTIAHYSQHSRLFVKKALTVVKEIFREGQNNIYFEEGTATCELILEGENVGNKIPDAAYYAFVPAHFVLKQDDMERLLDENVHEGADKHIQRDTAGKTVDDRYFMKMFNSPQVLTLDARDVMYSYRHYEPKHGDNSPAYTDYMNDSYLLKIEKSEFSKAHDLGPAISRDQLEESMKMAQDGAPLGNAFPVKDLRQLRRMGRHKVKVQVGAYYGYMITAGLALDLKDGEQDDRPQIAHVQFIMDNW